MLYAEMIDGLRVRIVAPAIDLFPHAMIPRGLTGTVRILPECAAEMCEVVLDSPMQGLEEWDNAIHVFANEGEGGSTAADYAPADLAETEARFLYWAEFMGAAFHPDTRGADFMIEGSPMSAEWVAAYDSDMEAAFAHCADPYAVALRHWARIGVISAAEMES